GQRGALHRPKSIGRSGAALARTSVPIYPPARAPVVANHRMPEPPQPQNVLRLPVEMPLPPAFEVGTALSLGWRAYSRSYPMLLAVVGIDIVHGLAIGALQNQLTVAPGTTALISWGLSLFVAVPLNAGAAFVGVKAARGERISFNDVFLGFTRYR